MLVMYVVVAKTLNNIFSRASQVIVNPMYSLSLCLSLSLSVSFFLNMRYVVVNFV